MGYLRRSPSCRSARWPACCLRVVEMPTSPQPFDGLKGVSAWSGAVRLHYRSGFNAVFRITDLPSLVSAGSIMYFDPHCVVRPSRRSRTRTPPFRHTTRPHCSWPLCNDGRGESHPSRERSRGHGKLRRQPHERFGWCMTLTTVRGCACSRCRTFLASPAPRQASASTLRRFRCSNSFRTNSSLTVSSAARWR